MNTTTLKWLAVIVVATAGGFYAYRLHTLPEHVPGDLRDAVAGGALDTLKSGAAASEVKIPEPGKPAADRASAAEARLAEFQGRGYSIWQPESMAKAQGELDAYTFILKKNGIVVVKAGVQEVEGYLQAKVSYEGKEALFREKGSAFTILGARVKMKKRVKELLAGGAVILNSEAWTGHDEWGSGGAYAIEYFLKDGRNGDLAAIAAGGKAKAARIEAGNAQEEGKPAVFNAADGTRIKIEYAMNDYHGESSITASPWITVSNPAFKGDEKITAVLTNYYATTGQTEGTRNVPLKYADNGGFTAQAGPVDTLFFSRSGNAFSFRQEIAVEMNGRWLEDQATGGHNFGFTMY